MAVAADLPWYWTRKIESFPATLGYAFVIGQTTDPTDAYSYLANGIYLVSFCDTVPGSSKQCATWLAVQNGVMSYIAYAGNAASQSVGPTPFNNTTSLLLVAGNTLVLCNGVPTSIAGTVNATVYRFI